MKGALALRNPAGTTPAVLDTSSTNVTSGAYVEIKTAALMLRACSAIAVHNPGAAPLALARGAAGSEVQTGVVLPVGAFAIIPIELAKAVRLSLISLGATQSSGIITVTFLS